MKEKVFLTAGVLCLAYYGVCGIYGNFKISALWIWLLTGLGFVAAGLGLYHGVWTAAPAAARAAVRVLAVLFLCVFLLVEAAVISGLSAKGEPDLDYLEVLGAAVKGTEPGEALRLRIQAAARYLEANPRTVAIVSGGRGTGEEITEAECMERELLRLGIPPERIVQENRSQSTAENIRFSYELMPGQTARVGVLSNNFHIFRAVAIARKQANYPVCGIAAPYSGILLPHYMVREFMTLVVDKLRGNL